MNNHSPDEEDLVSELQALRPRRVTPALTARLAQELGEVPVPLSRPKNFRRVAAFTSAAALLVAGVYLVTGSPTVPEFELVRAEQSPTNLELLQPVRLEDGSYARPLRMHWDNTTHWEDRRTQAQFINYRPVDQVALLPLETY